MEAEFWHNMWQNNKIGFHLNEINKFLLNNFQRLELSRGSRVFLPLCGKTNDIKWLLLQGQKVVGVELSQIAIDNLFDSLEIVPTIKRIDKFIHYSAENIDIFIGDFFNLTTNIIGKVDAVYDRAAIVALPSHMRLNYTKHLIDISNKSKQLVITLQYDEFKKNGPPFSVNDVIFNDYYKDIFLIKELEVDKDKNFEPLEVIEKIWLLEKK